MAPTTRGLDVWVAAAVAVAVPLAALARPQLPPLHGFENGMTEAAYSPNVFATAVSDRSVRALRATGTRWLSIQTAWYQTSDTSTDIAPWSQKTPTDASVVHLIRLCHALGMRVFLDPFVNAKYGNAWQAAFKPVSWPAWFRGYDRAIVHYARLAQANGVDLFAIGDENDTSDMKPELYPEYRRLIREVKSVYHGPVTYGADWPNYQGVTFWRLLDVVGLDAYFPLASGTGDPPLSSLAAAWSRTADQVAAWRARSGLLRQPVVITELGYPSEAGAAQNPGSYIRGQPLDLGIQTRLYEATFRTVYQRPWLNGIYWFWWLNPSDFGWPGGPKDNGYGLQGKPALRVVERYFAHPRPPASVA